MPRATVKCDLQFPLVSPQQRTEWFRALARHLAVQVTVPSETALTSSRIDEQIPSMMATVAVLIERGVTDPQAIIVHVTQEKDKEYAAEK
jgi:hypothetical protein